jgi:hypothetical protein
MAMVDRTTVWSQPVNASMVLNAIQPTSRQLAVKPGGGSPRRVI